MRVRERLRAAFGSLGAMMGLAVLLGGCNASTSLTAEEKANIQGKGEMPPEAQNEIQKRLQKSQQTMNQDAERPTATR